jgi:hypothetical protein
MANGRVVLMASVTPAAACVPMLGKKTYPYCENRKEKRKNLSQNKVFLLNNFSL